MTAQKRRAARYSRQCERRRDAQAQRELAGAVALFLLAVVLKAVLL